jgi:hypothetical protein
VKKNKLPGSSFEDENLYCSAALPGGYIFHYTGIFNAVKAKSILDDANLIKLDLPPK